MQSTSGREMMRIAGYKLNGYNATYEKCVLDVVSGVNANNKRVLEVTDLFSGITYLFETEEILSSKKRRKHSKK